MWENAAPTPPPQANDKNYGKRRAVSQPDEDFVVWGQLLVSLVILGLVVLAQMMNWPFLPELRIAFREALNPEQGTFLSENRELSKFTESAAQAIAETVQQILPEPIQASTSETALRQGHAKSQSIPSGARQESYLPDFALQFPLSGYGCTYTSGYGWRTDPMGGSGSDFIWGMTWPSQKVLQSWPLQKASYAVPGYTAAMAITCAFCMPTVMRPCMLICNICLSIPGSRYLRGTAWER